MVFQPFHLFFLLDHGNVNKVFQFNFDVCFSVCFLTECNALFCEGYFCVHPLSN